MAENKQEIVSVVELPSTSPSKESKGSVAKEIREWSAIGLSLGAVLVSVASYWNSNGSIKLDQRRFNAARALTLIAEKDKDLRANGFAFRFHPLSANQHLSALTATVPSDLSEEPLNAGVPDQSLYLGSLYSSFEQILLKTPEIRAQGPVLVYVQIPIVIDALYSVDGETMKARGLYTVSTVGETYDTPSRLPSITFEDVIFQALGDPSAGAQDVVDQAWKEEKEGMPKHTRRVVTLQPGVPIQ